MAEQFGSLKLLLSFSFRNALELKVSHKSEVIFWENPEGNHVCPVNKI